MREKWYFKVVLFFHWAGKICKNNDHTDMFVSIH